MKKAILLLITVMILVACGVEGNTTSVADDTSSVREAAAGEPTLASAEATLTSEKATSTASATPAPFTAMAQPEATPTIVEPPTATATLAPTPTSAPHVNVEQAPYAPSNCSDKYPCNDDVAGWEARLRVPSGFEARYFARVEGQPTSLAFGPDGLLYVATQSGEIVTVDETGQVAPFFSGLDTPTGLAFQPGTDELYVSSRLVNENSGGEAQVGVIRDGELSQVFGEIPCCYTFLHAANGIAFGPDGYGYVAVGARADHGEILPGNPGAGQPDELHPWEAAILRFSPDGSEVEAYAYGLRNSYDLTWDASGRLFATDNAPDFGPPDELHLVQAGGQHGYPWYECDVCFAAPDNVSVIEPVHEFVPHGAAAGISAYVDERFPGYYNNLFAVLWSAFAGAQKVVRLSPGGTEASDFATGFAAPIDVAVGPDGALFVADYATGIVFRIDYMG